MTAPYTGPYIWNAAFWGFVFIVMVVLVTIFANKLENLAVKKGDFHATLRATRWRERFITWTVFALCGGPILMVLYYIALAIGYSDAATATAAGYFWWIVLLLFVAAFATYVSHIVVNTRVRLSGPNAHKDQEQVETRTHHTVHHLEQHDHTQPMSAEDLQAAQDRVTLEGELVQEAEQRRLEAQAAREEAVRRPRRRPHHDDTDNDDNQDGTDPDDTPPAPLTRRRHTVAEARARRTQQQP